MDKTLRVWEINSGNVVKILFHNNHLITSFDISHLNKYLITGGEDGRIIFRDFSS